MEWGREQSNRLLLLQTSSHHSACKWDDVKLRCAVVDLTLLLLLFSFCFKYISTAIYRSSIEMCFFRSFLLLLFFGVFRTLSVMYYFDLCGRPSCFFSGSCSLFFINVSIPKISFFSTVNYFCSRWAAFEIFVGKLIALKNRWQSESSKFFE